MTRIETDVLLVGSGLGATAAAKELLSAGYRVVLVPGIGRTRSPHIDGGLVDAGIVTSVFGDGAPLGEPVAREVRFRKASGGQFEHEAPIPIEPRRRYRRQELEVWTMQRVVTDGATYLDDFIEGKVLPAGDGPSVLTSERDDREIHAQVIALCEGADPRIPMRVHLRPDYGPEDQLHFARTILHGEPLGELRRGTWRTTWGMPVEVSLVPQSNGTIVSVVTRIENVMRASRSSRDALEDLLASAAFESLGVAGERGETGMELVALRPSHRGLAFVHDRLVMGVDASGVIDPRRTDRADLTILAGRHLAAYLSGRTLALDGWHERATGFIRDAVPPPGAYHDDKETGYLEEGRAVRYVAARLAGLIRRPPRAIAGKR